MKKNFVKYFGVASTTLLAVAPVATPALMTASNLTVVKAGVQDDITAAFKTDNSLVKLTADQWKGLTSTAVSYAPDSTAPTAYPQSYLTQLEKYAEAARKTTADSAKTAILAGPSITNQTIGTYWAAILATTPNPTWNVKSYTLGDGHTLSSIKSGKSIAFKEWVSKINDGTTPPTLTYKQIFGYADQGDEISDKQDLAERAYDNIQKLPKWYFISAVLDPTNDFTLAKDEIPGKVQGGDNLFKAIEGTPEPANNGLVTVAPDGGIVPDPRNPLEQDYQPDNPALAYVGDNLVDLQKHTDLELLNLVPSYNQGSNKSGTIFSKAQAQFTVSGGTVTASNKVSDGSKVWSTILQAVLNPKDAVYPLYNLTSSNIVKTKMLVNGKDATKNEFITKDEIQNADRISIQFVFKTNDGNEYKSPTVWLTHGNKFTVNTTGLANITRLPGDYYDPAAGITGTINDSGLPMDRKKFVVVPAGTDLAYYTDEKGNVDLSKLAALQGGILGTNGVAVNRGNITAFEGGKLDANQYWTDPSYFYSKFGSYNDAVDIYYIDGTTTTEGGTNTDVVSKTAAESKAAAVSAVHSMLEKDVANSTTAKMKVSDIWAKVEEVMKPYLKTSTSSIQSQQMYFGLTKRQLGEVFASKDTASTPHDLYITKNNFNKNDAEYPKILEDGSYVAGSVGSSGTNNNNLTSSYYKGTGLSLFDTMLNSLSTDLFKVETSKATTPITKVSVPSSQLTKIVANAGRTTKVDVPSKYLPQVSFNHYKGATYYGNGATINNWFNYSWNTSSGSTSGNDPYYPAGGVIVTGGTSAASSSAAKQPTSYLAPAAFAANSISAEQLQARVTDNIQKFMTTKLSNPNTQTDSKADGYFKAYNIGDAAYAYIKNGAVPSSDLKIDTSKVDVTKPGTYYVEVTYTPLNTIKNNTYDGSLAATNGNVAITDASGNIFEKGSVTNKPFVEFGTESATVPTNNAVSGGSSSLTSFAADQIFANGAPATYKLPVQITDGSTSPQSGAPVIAFTEGGQNLKIAKGGTFDQFKGLQFYAYPGAKAWDQKDDSVKVEVSGKVNTNVEGTYTLVYTVTNKAGKTSTLTRVITVGDGVEKPTEYEFNLSQAYIDYVPGYNVREYGYPGDEWAGKQIKHGTSVSVTKRAVFQNGEEWYKLGDGNWVKKQYVKAGQNPNEAVEARGVVTVNYVPGYGIAVYKEPGKSALVQVNGKAKRLAHGTSWKSFKKQIVNNVTYYNVGGNQWVNGNFVIFK